MGILGFIAAILFLLFILWSRKESKSKTPTTQNDWYCYPETNSIIELFEENNINYEITNDNDECIIYKFDFKVENGTFKCFLERRRKEKLIYFYIYVLEEIPFNKFIDISVFCTLMNSEFNFGNFELDNNEDILRFRTSYIYDESASSFKKILFTNINYSLHVVETLIPDILSFEYSNKNSIQSYREQISGFNIHLN